LRVKEEDKKKGKRIYLKDIPREYPKVETKEISHSKPQTK